MEKDFFKKAIEVLETIILAATGGIQVFSRDRSILSLRTSSLKLGDFIRGKLLAGVPP